jgi:FtsP/CotA-like multicopper oxidase with cupredoxin domain
MAYLDLSYELLSNNRFTTLMMIQVIHDPTEQTPPVEGEKIIFLGDWYHTYASVLVASYLNPTSKWSIESGVEALADNLLMNGRNEYNCSIESTTFPPNQTATECSGGSLYTTKVDSGKAYRLRLINHSTFFSFWFSVDNHTLEIVEIDGVEIEPVTFRGVNVNIGQRYSVIIRTNQTVGNYYMRANFPTSCFLPFVPYNSSGLDSSRYHVLGILSYDDTDPKTLPIGMAGDTTNPFGAAENPYNYLVWEGCDDMPFNMTVPMRQQPAYNASTNNTHYVQYAFSQAQNINRIFVNKVNLS